MNIGELKHKISLIKEETSPSSTRFTTSTWTEWKKVWAKMEKEKRSKIILNEQITENRTILFTIRYQDFDLKGVRIRYKSKDYEITNIEDKDFEQKFLVLSASEVV
ncbi:phage head closure protein [Sutcliffiella horikoshii]|uniref:phage head closure protein n=1 Tax=Sutcliffiella horikoshii TaxID=79883 RepID=UPI003CF00125